MSTLLRKASVTLIGCVMAACAGGPAGEDDVQAGNAPRDGTGARTAQSSNDADARQAGQQINDPAYAGMVELGTRDGWSLYLDKETSQIVASDGHSTVTFTSNDLEDDTKVAALVASGIPETLLWSWKGVLCRAGCWTAAGLGCGAVSIACSGVTAITLGGFAIPCAWAILAACGAGGAEIGAS